jgi:hypothetical protein
MVGIVGILLLGSLAWSAVGALFNALGSLTSSVAAARPPAGGLPALVATASPQTTPIVASVQTPPGTASPTPLLILAPTVAPTPRPTDTPLPEPTPAPTSEPTQAPTPQADGRAPWILLPQPAPDSKVAPGTLTIEARGRGDTTITAIRLELDGAALPVSLEQRSESTWRGAASAQVGPGKHTVRATVVDDQNRTGGYRWTFDAGP